ncbi:MAG: NTP transferase domain-containing protein [Ignavibacteria bacterium]|nr:NTP transferase domain-containing protein [Ignavibacteria bacterium]
MQKRIYGLILSAGLSGRMKMFKPFATYNGKTFVYNIITKLDKICDEIIIVTGFNSDELKIKTIQSLKDKNQSKVIKKIKFTFNDSFEKGMFTSLQKGIAEAKNCDWVLYHFVDQPGLPDNFYPEFIKQTESHYNWIQPIKKGQKGHPILIGKDLFELIANSSPDSNLREMSKNPIVKKKFWECNYAEIFQDIDTEDDYSKLE